jgi:hypothetical protein
LVGCFRTVQRPKLRKKPWSSLRLISSMTIGSQMQLRTPKQISSLKAWRFSHFGSRNPRFKGMSPQIEFDESTLRVGALRFLKF